MSEVPVLPAVVTNGTIIHSHRPSAAVCNNRCHVTADPGPILDRLDED